MPALTVCHVKLKSVDERDGAVRLIGSDSLDLLQTLHRICGYDPDTSSSRRSSESLSLAWLE